MFVKRDNIILIGFMGTGKSTVGRHIAGRLGFAFVDTDKRIEEEQGVTIPQIFERQGELEFRKLETEVIRRVVADGRQVVATGGGAVLAEENRSAMLRGGYVVALKADQAVIVDRVSRDQGRPLLQGGVESRVAALMEARRTAYDFADLIVDTTGLTPEQVASKIIDTYTID